MFLLKTEHIYPLAFALHPLNSKQTSFQIEKKHSFSYVLRLIIILFSLNEKLIWLCYYKERD